MAINRTRYRQLDFIGARILQARELNWLQEMAQGVAVTDNETPVDGQLQSIFRQGAAYNIAVGVSGLNVTLTAADGINPMMIFVRDRWEIFPGANDDCTDSFNGTRAGNQTMQLTGSETVIYLNWELVIRTGGLTGDDPTLTDATTNEPVASAGELILHLSDVDTSGNPLGVNQIAKNTAPIPLFSFTNSGTVLTYQPADNVQSQAHGTTTSGGLVKTTTGNSQVVSTDDSRIGAAVTSVADSLVHDSTVRTPVAFGGTNADGSPIYKLTTDGGTDIGGISAAKIIMITATQTLEAGWNLLKTAFNTLLGRYNAHETAALGLVNTHPIPTAAQVGAAPLSHVGLPLGLVTSHPPVVNQNSGGFAVNQSVDGAANDPAFGVFTLGSNRASLNHDGDVFSNKANGTSSPAVGSLSGGPLGLMSAIATILAGHQNQHGTGSRTDSNPHGITAADLGAASIAYVDAGDANTLAAADLYTDGKFTGFAISKVANGYIKLPTSLGGLIIQWCKGTATTANGTVLSTNFPISFPTTCLFASVSGQTSGTDYGEMPVFSVTSVTSVKVSYYFQRNSDHGGMTLTPLIFAIGY